MKKEAVFILGLFILIIGSGIVTSEENSSLDGMTENQRASLAYTCLVDEIEERGCSSLSTEEQIYSLLSVGECYDEVMDSSRLDECWPKTNCDIKTTSLAALALDNYGEDTEKITEWLFSQNTTPKDLDWYLQIESDVKTDCSINYSGQEYPVEIGEDKKISSGAGSCLSLSTGDYWLQIDSDCYDQEFEVSCEDDFLTNLLFNRPGSSTIYVVDETHSSSGGGITSEGIKSHCFSLDGNCDYESSLWAAMALKNIGEEVQNFVPYLMTYEDENPQEFPSSFLYAITGFQEYKLEVLSKQANNAYWDIIDGRYYSSALALYPFQGMELNEKNKTIEWLFEEQSEEGCWDNKNVKNNAFLIHSLWPKNIKGPSFDPDLSYDDDDQCVEEGYDCLNYQSCSTENILNYDCSGSLVCCSSTEDNQVDSCSSMDGELCEKDTEICAGPNAYVEEEYSDVGYGEVCCISGYCKTKTDEGEREPECEREGGTCQTGSCDEGDKKTIIYDCSSSGEICCVPESTEEPIGEKEEEKSYWWLWVLFALIVLTTLGIVFRDKIREYIIRIKTRGDKKGGAGGVNRGIPPRGPPSYPRKPIRRPLPPRKILPPSNRPNRAAPGQRAPVRKPLPNSKNKELDDVLKKLKEMGE